MAETDKITDERVWLDAYNTALLGLLSRMPKYYSEDAPRTIDEARMYADRSLALFRLRF